MAYNMSTKWMNGTSASLSTDAPIYDTNGNPSKIYFTNGNVTKYVYSAAGEKLRVEYRVAVPNTTVTFGVEPDALTQSQTMYAGSTDYLLGGASSGRTA